MTRHVCHVSRVSRVTILSRVTRSEAAAPGADTRLVMFEGSSAGKNMVSFTTGGDLLMGRNIIRRWTTDKLDHYIYIQNLVLFIVILKQDHEVELNICWC